MAEKKTVLIVEDNEDISTLLKQLLEAYGCRARLADVPDEAKVIAGQEQVDLLLLDIMFPEGPMRGRDLARELRDAGHTFPIYFMTGLRKSEIGAEALERVDGVLRKPFTARELRVVLERSLGALPDAEKEPSTRDILGLMTSVATQQEEIRRQQARLSTFLTVQQEGVGEGTSQEGLDRFRRDSARYEDGLARVEATMAEIQEMLRRRARGLSAGQERLRTDRSAETGERAPET